MQINDASVQRFARGHVYVMIPPRFAGCFMSPEIRGEKGTPARRAEPISEGAKQCGFHNGPPFTLSARRPVLP